MAGSEYLELIRGVVAGKPAIDLDLEVSVQRACRELIAAGVAKSAHDCSDGGMAVAVAESALIGDIGADIAAYIATNRDAVLFGEGQSRIIVSVAPRRHGRRKPDMRRQQRTLGANRKGGRRHGVVRRPLFIAAIHHRRRPPERLGAGAERVTEFPMTIAQKMAQFAYALNLSDIPSQTSNAPRGGTSPTPSPAASAHTDIPPVRALVRYARKTGGRGSAALLGYGDKTSPAMACFGQRHYGSLPRRQRHFRVRRRAFQRRHPAVARRRSG